MSELKAVLRDLVPQDWKSFAMGLLCIAVGAWSTEQPTWVNHAIAVVALVAAGFNIWNSIWMPKFKKLGEEFGAMERRWRDFQPETVSTRIAAAVRQEIVGMQARGELPPDVHITVEMPDQKPPPGRLN